MTRGYLKLNESSNLLQENPIDRRNWPNREDTQRGMLDECKFLGEVKLWRVKVR